MIKLFIFLANILLPATSLFLAFKYPDVSYGILFSIGLAAHVSYRMWETFFTSKERKPQKFEGDWTLAVGTFAYILLCFLITFEYFLMPHSRFLTIFIIGCMIYFVAARLRFWGESTLGRQWAVHVIGDAKLEKSRLLRIGPYKYIRHPIYLGILLEEVALPLLACAYFSLIFAFVINIPLLLVRLMAEENVSVNKFGEAFMTHKKEAGIFLPKKNKISFIKELLTRIK